MPAHPTVGFLLHDSARLMRKRFEQRARAFGLSRSQWQLIAALKHNEGIQQGALADLMDIEPITLVRLLDRSQKAGLVERRPDPKDRRAWRLFLTEEAHPMLEIMQGIGAATREEAMNSLSEEDRAHLFRILEVVRGNLADACSRPAETEEFEAEHA
ncbi:MarR family transcriptional regulator [Terrarubrum flagellatum]|uniref:MarR family winged helix-turn-helix transcriptional regulator n=1 Tax=Terrirubrum flagellatum TaxID=2895980 RepID=UPI003144D813